MVQNKIVITAALRTAVGSLGKSLRNIRAENLGSAVISDLIKSTKLSNVDIDETIMGQVLTGGMGQNPARQAAINLESQKKNQLILLIRFVVQA